jgi:Flp pilus assembly pilin Flp
MLNRLRYDGRHFGIEKGDLVRILLGLLKDKRGAAAIEYGLGIAMAAIISITAWGAIGSHGATAQAAPIAQTQQA